MTYTISIAPLSGFTSESNNRNAVETIAETNGTILYPNSSQTNCVISAYKAIQRIRVYDLGGRKMEDIFVNGSVLYELNTSDFSNGLFQIEIQTEESTELKKLLVSH